MYNHPPVSQLENSFRSYLKSKGLKKISIKNYMSDLSSFSVWLMRTARLLGASAESLLEAVPFISKETAAAYKAFLSKNLSSKKTINRKLSGLRHFSKFLYANELLDFDFAKELTNVGRAPEDLSIIDEFEEHLKSEDFSKNTIKNYLSDIKHFIDWAEKKGAQ